VQQHRELISLRREISRQMDKLKQQKNSLSTITSAEFAIRSTVQPRACAISDWLELVS